tara:strand:- start:1290 stop:1775 length:486 start_codon:yes stop_codon:yes gene_type:complete
MINIFVNNNLKKVLEENNIDVKDYVPAYNGESAGLDLFNAGNDITIMPHSNMYDNRKVLVQTGLHLIVPKGWVALIQERGSVVKTPLKVRAGVIDSGYTGEVFVNLVNVGNSEFTLKKGSKLPVQIVTVKCDNEYTIINEKEYLDLTQNTKRKDGQIGSSD